MASCADKALDAGAGRLERPEGGGWKELVSAPVAVLVLTETTCAFCHRWAEELERDLTEGGRHPGVRFGRIDLDSPEAAAFVEENREWLSRVDGVPFNVVYVGGEPRSSFAGGGAARLASRLERHTPPPAGSAVLSSSDASRLDR